MNLFELWVSGKLPEEWQKQADAFATARINATNAEQLFRGGWFCGCHQKQILKAMGVED